MVNSSQTWIQQFGYDRYGNRTSRSQTVLGQSMTIDETTLPSIDGYTNRFSNTTNYGFDAVGNLILDSAGRQFTFDGDNKQIEVQDSRDNTIGEYVYDGLGKRIKKITASETVVFVYDGFGKLIAEYSTDGPPQNPTVSYTATDPLGSPRVLTNENGSIISRRDFMPFGEEIQADSTYRTAALKYGVGDNVRQKFTGYERDDETGLDFAEARYYYSSHGRFTAVDPLLASGKSANPQTFNRYAYVMNRPMNLIDQTGLQAGTPPKTPTNKEAMDQANKAAGTFTQRDIERFNEARDNAIRMLAAPKSPAEINACRDALIANFGPADPVAALQGLKAEGGIVVLGKDVEGKEAPVAGPQNVVNGATSQLTIGAGANAQPVQEFFDERPDASAAYDGGYTYLDDKFFSGRGDVGRAQDLIHETVVHNANGKNDIDFAPKDSNDPQTDGSHAINAVIKANCGTIPKKKDED